MLDLNTLRPDDVVLNTSPVHTTRWVMGRERVVRIDYAGLIAVKSDRQNPDRQFVCPHRHRTKDAAIKCGQRTALQALRRNGYKITLPKRP